MFLRNLITAIVRIITNTTQPTVGIPVPPTQPVGPASQEPIIQAGSKPSAQTTKRRSPAQPRTQKKPKAAQSTTAAAKSTSKKQKPAQTAQSRKAAGSSTPTRASKTRQHAK